MLEGQRIYFVGNSGSGKTTAAREAASRLGCRHIELDDLHHAPNWALKPYEEFRRLVAEAVAADRWTADGNYSKVQDLILPRCDTIVWLDHPLAVTLSRLVRRTARRALTGEVLWHGNRESLRTQFFSRESLILYSIKRHRVLRQRYPALLAAQTELGKPCHRFRTEGAVREWLSELPLRAP